ncbi:iron complex outermembrane receptor protein [Novosphingobium kunmingense]|uniref:Iron complex outermembrane receptor protein n=1 Tax=Novosphingobium kunmingense TaxID=1211806 RepID=A0A2N0H387_9SPHN|nr:TonB-dependent receptor [Novosphingobium kunmingense]PKB13405.1 iron complex outermembrane receptor protein [Novosphingobium kunmingense]
MRKPMLPHASVTTLAIATALFASTAVSAAAQDAARADPAADDSDQVADIIVTAQRREQRLQDVPVSVTAFDSGALESQAVQNLTDLNAKTPNVVLAPVGAYPYASAFFIRGLGFADVESTFEPAVGVEMNGIYLARNSGALQDFFDIESVEILRGPQGTLYGRNTIGGVVSVRTKRPGKDAGGQIMATVGDHGRRELRAALETPVGDTFGVRVSGLYKNYDGYNYNATTQKRVGDNEVFSGRVTFVAEPSPDFEAALVIDYDRERGSGAAFRNASLPGNVYYHFSPDTGTPTPVVPAGNSDPTDPYTIYSNTPLFAKLDTWGLAFNADWHLGGATVTAVTGYREFYDKVQSDYDASALNFFSAYREQDHNQFSQEVRIASDGANMIDYVAGVYFLNQSYAITNTQTGIIYGGAVVPQIASQANNAYAAFGQIDVHPVEALTLTAGGRYSYENKTFTNRPLFFPVARTYKANWDNFSPKLGVSYKVSPDVMVYSSWSKGFRSGGFNGRAASYTSAGPYASETVSSLEAGFKSDLLDRRVRFNMAAFRATYSDMQVGSQGLTSGGVYESIVTNAGKARIDGVEAETQIVLGAGFRINANAAWLNARFLENMTDLTSDGVDNPTDNSDFPIAYAPKWSGAVGLMWDHETGFGKVNGSVNAVYQDDQYTSGGAANRTSNVQMRPANVLVDAALGIDLAAGIHIGGWVKNLLDKTVINNTFGLGPLGFLRIYAPPRTFGVDVGFKF